VTAAMVEAATRWPTNAHMIEDVVRLGYLRAADHVLDPTFEGGTWWKRWRPELLTALNRDHDGTDFRHLDYPDGHFDAIAYDPPYVCKGGRETSGIKEMDNRYGQEDAPASPAELQALMNDGLTEMHRLVKPARRRALHPSEPNGVVLMKCKDYISSGRLWPGTHLSLVHALELGFELEDRLEMVTGTGPQSQKRQVHARRNLSTLLVLRKFR
jgi:tRNA G10  N-methylase Trm11